MSLKARDVDKVFGKFRMKIKTGNDIYARLYYGGKYILRTKRSLGKHKIEDKVRYLIRQQLKLNEEEFAQAIDCSLKREGYIQILKRKDFIPTTKPF